MLFLKFQANTLDKRPQCVTSDSSRFITSQSLRSRYMGEIVGLLNKGETGTLTTELVDKVWAACSLKDDEMHGAALWRVTAFLILTPGKLLAFEKVKCKVSFDYNIINMFFFFLPPLILFLFL